MNFRPKYSLKLFLILSTVVIVFCGTSLYRRSNVLKMCAEFQRDGLVFETPAEWMDVLWQRKPTIGKTEIMNGSEILRTLHWSRGGPHEIWIRDPKEIDHYKKLGVTEERSFFKPSL
jgi:hypothetical protein